MQLDLLCPMPRQELDQWFTPAWAAELLVDRFFGDLTTNDLLLEPSCGAGAFLQAIPEYVPALGVELDPETADLARAMTGRRIITGDFCDVALPEGITAVVGNPPFQVSLISRFLARCHSLRDLRRAGFLLPAYSMQTHRTVTKWRQFWNLRAELVPRRLFPRLRLPLLFVLFERGPSRSMVGFALYDEAVQFDNLSKKAKEVLTTGRPRKGVWRALVETILEELGGEADLDQIYRAVEPRRPTPNAWWKEKVRQELQRVCEPVSRGRWRLAMAAPA